MHLSYWPSTNAICPPDSSEIAVVDSITELPSAKVEKVERGRTIGMLHHQLAARAGVHRSLRSTLDPSLLGPPLQNQLGARDTDLILPNTGAVPEQEVEALFTNFDSSVYTIIFIPSDAAGVLPPGAEKYLKQVNVSHA